MYKGYTNLELYDLFRAPKQTQHNFITFLNNLQDKPCETIKMKSLLEESESTISKDSAHTSSQAIMDSLDSQSVETTSVLTNGTLMKEQTSGMQSDLLDEQLPLEKLEAVQD